MPIPYNKSDLDLLDRSDHKVKKPPMYHVILLNDDFTTQDFVVFILQKIFHKSQRDAESLMLDVHLIGKGIAGTYIREVAETKVKETMDLAKLEQHPLMAVLEKT
jgi:ATP-dependent Clp protease adaptor protein ClpS